MTRNLLLAAFALTLFYSVAQATISGGSSGSATITGTPGDVANFSGSGALQDSGSALGSAAFQPSSAFDASGAAATVKSYFTALNGFLNCSGSACTATSTIGESALTPIATGTLLGNTSGSTAAPSSIPLASTTGDLNITSGGVVTVTGIQGASVSAPTGSGAVVLATSPTLNTATLGSGSVLTDTINQGYTASTIATTYTSNTTLGTISGLTVNVTTGGTYDCFGHLSVIADSAGGIKVTVNGTGLTVASTSFTFTNWNGATVNAKGTISALGTAAAAATASATDIDIQGVIVLTAGGTLYPQAAENASDATATTINKNSYFACQRVN